MNKRDRLVCRDTDNFYNTYLSKIATILESFLVFIIVYQLTWHHAGTRDTYMSMHTHTRVSHSYAYCFLLLARAFAHILVLL